MVRSITETFKEYADILSPMALHQFMGVQSWTLHSERPFAETWMRTNQPTNELSVVHLPRDPENVDFVRRLAEAAQDIAQSYDWTLGELAEQVATVHADIFYIRVGSSSVDGTIPLQHAGATIDAIEKMVRSAAITTVNPTASGRGRVSERVKEFLADDLRMGHTRRGSFVITVAARLEDESRTLELLDQAGRTVTGPAEIVDSMPGDPAPRELDFTRRTMTTLSRSLDAASRYLRGEDDFVDLTQAEEAGMTVPMIEALATIGSQAGVSDIDMRFEWSPVLEQDIETPERVIFEKPDVDRIPQAVERMKRRVEPANTVDVIGPVVALSRSTEGEASGQVQILADIEGRIKNVGVELEGRDYDWAIYAHQHHLPFHARGVLGKVSNRWKLTDEITVDTAYLTTYQDSRMDRATREIPEIDMRDVPEIEQ